MIPSILKNEIINQFNARFNQQLSILNHQSIGGGCINHAHQLKTNHGNFFLKWNDALRYPGMFEAEAKGLDLLRSINTIRIPNVIFFGEAGSQSFLLLEYIEKENPKKNFWNEFGKQLALLHKNSSDQFGLDYDNYIGSLNQCNHKHSNWIDFFINERIEPQIKLAFDSKKLANGLVSSLANLYKKLPEIFPMEKPSLLHGDLWNGNFMIADDGSACLIDPSVYYGNREMDLAMTKLFGGFTVEFYESYNETFPLEKDFEKRIEIYQLYPLLVHVNLFGQNYIQQVESILKRYN
jgi:protein-ribulosamine 3-kinase